MPINETPQTFHAFTRLPAELQDCVWQYAIDAIPSRVVNLRLENNCGRERKTESGNTIIGYNLFPEEFAQYTSACPIPSVLHTCRDSRDLASKRWRLAFPRGRWYYRRLAHKTIRTRFDSCPKVFFDFSRDILWLGDDLPAFVQSVCEKDRHALRKVAFDWQETMDCEEPRYCSNTALAIHEDLPFLSQIVLVQIHGGSYSVENHLDRKSLVHLADPTPRTLTVHHDLYGDELEEFNAFHKQRGWDCPELKVMDYFVYGRGFAKALKTWDEQ
jgi:hypothetical protein